MEILKYILLGIEAILSIVLIVLMMMQSSKSDGASGAISGGASSDGYLGKNMDRSKDANLARATMFSGIAFMVVTFVLGLLYII